MIEIADAGTAQTELALAVDVYSAVDSLSAV